MFFNKCFFRCTPHITICFSYKCSNSSYRTRKNKKLKELLKQIEILIKEYFKEF